MLMQLVVLLLPVLPVLNDLVYDVMIVCSAMSLIHHWLKLVDYYSLKYDLLVQLLDVTEFFLELVSKVNDDSV